MKRRAVMVGVVLAGSISFSGVSRGQGRAETGSSGAEPPIAPPPTNVDYLQFGVAFIAEVALNPGPVCPADAKAPCILGSGGGLNARAGYRSRGPWYVGGVYGFSRIETNGMMRLGVLQHLGADMRYLLPLGQRAEPYFTSGLALVSFGNEWGLDTWGASTHAGLGFEVELSRTTVVGLSLVYRPVLLVGWTDRGRQDRPTGIAHYLGLDVLMEAREPLRTH